MQAIIKNGGKQYKVQENDIILLNGKVSKRIDKLKIIVNNIKRKWKYYG